MDLKKYFQEEYNNMEFVNADGEAEEIPTHFADGKEATHYAISKPNLEIGKEIVKEEAPTPLILSIIAGEENTGGAIEFLNAIKYATVDKPEELATGVTAYYNIGGITYKQFLTELLGGFSAQIVKMELISDNTSVLLTPITVVQSNLQGERYSKPIIPRYNSFQNLQNQIEIPTNFFLTRETAFEFIIPSGAFSIEYRLYPLRISSNISTLYAGGYTYKQIPQSGYPMIQGGGMPIQRV